MIKRQEYSALADVIHSQIRGRDQVYYLANPGNWGDALIRHGTLKFFDYFNIPFLELRRRKPDWILPMFKGGVVVFGGGGAWCNRWDHSSYVAKLSRRFNVIVLPSTYENQYQIRRTTFFRRDNGGSQSLMPQARFCHDMAFFIGNEFEYLPEGSGTGNFFRTDSEASGAIEIPEGNLDLSACANEHEPIDRFFQKIATYSIIKTDRLHVAIAAALLGRETYLHTGVSFKIKAVYNASIKEYFNNVALVE
jgi:exopolysaccharide biosynthesis predicted pyruvyltransferase EpsI